MTRRRNTALAFVLACAAMGVTCSDRTDAARASDVEPANQQPRDGAIGVDPVMLSSIKVETIADRETANVLAVAGKVQFDEDRVARVLAPLSGQVVGLRVKVGDAARKGETLCAISSRDAALAIGDEIESRKDVELAEKNAAMIQDLFDHEAASKMALQQAQNDLAKARARAARTGEALRVLGLSGQDDLAHVNGRVPITSPIAGLVFERKVTDGQFVQSDSTPILTIANLDAVWVMGDVFERDLHLVTKGQAATVTTAAYPGERFEGRVNHISEAIDPATRTAKVRVSVANPRARLKPEMFAAIQLHVSEPQRTLTVPTNALFTEEGRSYVYVEVGRARFARRGVEIANGEGSERRVISGLRSGDRVVVDGALLLRQEQQQRGSGASRLIEDYLAGGASRLAALLLPHIIPVCSVVAPCHPGAALRDLVLVQPRPATS
jgi:membrane fusion protein, heavy metal efflux system